MLGQLLNLGQPINWSHPLNRGLISQWAALPNNYGGGTLFDIAGSNHGALTNFARSGNTSNWVPGRLPGRYCLHFNGTNDYVTLGSFANLIPDLTQNVTSSLWIRTSAPSNDFHIPLGFLRTGGNTIYQIAIERAGANKLELFIRDEGVRRIWVSSSTVVNNDRWHHIVAVKNGNTANDLSLFVNGLVQSLTVQSNEAFANPNGTENLYIGARNNAGAADNHLSGLIDDVRIYSRALSADEVWQLYVESLLGYPTVWNWFEQIPSSALAAATLARHARYYQSLRAA